MVFAHRVFDVQFQDVNMTRAQKIKHKNESSYRILVNKTIDGKAIKEIVLHWVTGSGKGRKARHSNYGVMHLLHSRRASPKQAFSKKSDFSLYSLCFTSTLTEQGLQNYFLSQSGSMLRYRIYQLTGLR